MQNKNCFVDNSIYAVNSICHSIAVLCKAAGVQIAVVVQITEVVHIEVVVKMSRYLCR